MAAFDNSSLWTAAGLDAIHVAYRNTNGYMAGFSNLSSTSTPNTGSGMRRLKAAQTVPFSLPETQNKPILGDDTVFDSFMFGASDVLGGILEVGQDDNVFNVAADGTVSKAVGIYTFYGSGDTIVNPGTFMFLLTRQAHESGISGWENELYMNCRVKALGSDQKAHQAEGKFRYSVNFNNSDKMPWTETISAAFSAVYRRSMKWASLYRSMLHIWIADGSAAVTTALDYTPVDAASTKAFNASTGAALTVSSVNMGAKTVTLSAAPTPSGTPIIVLYQTPSF